MDPAAEQFQLIQAYQRGENDNIQYTPQGYTRDNAFSSPDRAVFVKDGKASVIFRATNVKNMDDIYADLHIATGTENWSQRFKDSDAATQAIVKKYGANNVTVSGYSLGGSQAMYLSDKYKLKSYVYNPGFSPADSSASDRKDYSRVTAYLTPGDIISNSLYTAKFNKNAPTINTVGNLKQGLTATANIAADVAGVPRTKEGALAAATVVTTEVAFPEFIPELEAAKRAATAHKVAGDVVQNELAFHDLDMMNSTFSYDPNNVIYEESSSSKKMEEPAFSQGRVSALNDIGINENRTQDQLSGINAAPKKLPKFAEYPYQQPTPVDKPPETTGSVFSGSDRPLFKRPDQQAPAVKPEATAPPVRSADVPNFQTPMYPYVPVRNSETVHKSTKKRGHHHKQQTQSWV